MKIGFLIIGSEVLDGKIGDLNTKLLAEFLRSQQLEINEAVVVRDHKDAIDQALHKLFSSNDLIVTSGGLGPTKDDITKETLGAFLGRKLVFSEESVKIAEENYARFNRTYPGKDHGYSFLPQGFVPLSNSTGFAPGFYTKHEDKVLFSAPGVPREFKSMLQDHLMLVLSGKINHNGLLKHFIVRTKNVPEEKIFSEVDPALWKKLERYGEVSSLPILMGVDIGVKLKARNTEEMEKKVSVIKEIFEESPVKKHIWNYGPESIEEKIVVMATEKKIKFGFAESATGGLCSHRITNVSGSSKCFVGSIICYDEKIKENHLGVNRKTLDEKGVVSAECAEEMAKGLTKSFDLDIAISITGLAGPTGGSHELPVGSVFIGRAGKNDKSMVESFQLKGDRDILKQRFSQAALYALLEEVERFAGI